MKKEDYVNSDIWGGSYYELGIELNPTRDSDRLLKAIRAIWEMPILQGPWRKIEQYLSPPRIPTAMQPEGCINEFNRLYGLVKMLDQHSLACLTLTVREKNGPDWLDFSIPWNMLDMLFSVEGLLSPKDNPWLNTIDNVLIKIAQEVYRKAPYNLAAIGEEVSGTIYARELNDKRLREGFDFEGDSLTNHIIISPDLYQKVQPTIYSKILDSGQHLFSFEHNDI